jgi:hypothetical protein
MSGVTAVIVHWEDLADTRGCVESVATQPEIDQVVVVDNASHEPVGDDLRDLGARTLRSDRNRGFAGGANLGLRDALERGAETVLLLNNDVRLEPGATAAAARMLASDPRIAVVGGKVLLRDDPSRLYVAWGSVNWHQSLVTLAGAGAPDGAAFRETRDVEWVPGCALWLRAAALRALGFLDEEFFAYVEEVDWCTRARAAGWRVVFCPDAVLTHAGRGMTGNPRAIRIRKYFAARNSILFARKHARPHEWARLACFLAASLPLELLWHLPRGTAGDVWFKVRGIRDALANRRPPFEALGLR